MTVSTATTPAAPPGPITTAKRPPRRLITPMAIGAAVLIVVSAVGYLATATPDSNRTPGLAAVPPSAEPQPQPHASADSPAAARLIAVADLISVAPADSQTGRYVYAVIEHWSRAVDQIIGFLDTSWHGDDGTAHRQEQRTPAHTARNFDLAKIGVPGTFNPYPPTANTYSAAEGFSFLERHGTPPSANPERLTRQIDSDNGGPPVNEPCPPACGRTIEPHVFLEAVIGLYRETYLDRDMRAAVLRTVAVLPGLTYLGPVDDRAGRPGIGVFLAHDGVRTTLVFDRHTGVLLASERAVPGFVLDDYSLYRLFERRDSLPQTVQQPTR